MDIFLIKFFVALRRTEAITWENVVPVKRDPGSTKAGSRLARIKLFPCNHRTKIYEEFTILPGSRQTGTEFHPGKTGSCNYHNVKSSIYYFHVKTNILAYFQICKQNEILTIKYTLTTSKSTQALYIFLRKMFQQFNFYLVD